MLKWFRNRLKWWIAAEEMAEVERWRVRCSEYDRWLASYPDIAPGAPEPAQHGERRPGQPEWRAGCSVANRPARPVAYQRPARAGVERTQGELTVFYTRTSERTLFLLPAIAVGLDVDGRPFLEIAWLMWAIGIGDAP